MSAAWHWWQHLRRSVAVFTCWMNSEGDCEWLNSHHKIQIILDNLQLWLKNPNQESWTELWQWSWGCDGQANWVCPRSILTFSHSTVLTIILSPRVLFSRLCSLFVNYYCGVTFLMGYLSKSLLVEIYHMITVRGIPTPVTITSTEE
jgi:hypothetical protein